VHKKTQQLHHKFNNHNNNTDYLHHRVSQLVAQ